MKYVVVLASLVLLANTVSFSADETSQDAAAHGRTASAVTLVWHVDGAGETKADSEHPDVPVNPASVVKAATSLWALERLGSERRFETTFGIRGSLDPESGRLQGDLIVIGGDDPDFHVENAFLVARSLNRSGVREVTGKLLTDEAFWIGWEGGSERRTHVASQRVAVMGERLRAAFDPDRWDPATRDLIGEFGRRRDIDVTNPPRIVIQGGLGNRDGNEPDRLLVLHRSNELSKTLRRFNAYSNNDIERLQPLLGSADELAQFLQPRMGEARVRLETLSGLGSNRMTPRQIVELLVQLRAACTRMGLALSDVLPVTGCDAGTLERFSDLAEVAPGAVIAKTGSLAKTDGGISVLAGLARAQSGEFYFVVAAPQNQGRFKRARAAQERWLLERIAARGGAVEAECGAPLEYSDSGAEVVAVDAE